MQDKRLLAAALATLLVVSLGAASGEVAPLSLGQQLPAVSLPDYYGHTFNLAEYWNKPAEEGTQPAWGGRVVVLMFFGVNCPKSRLYNERVNGFYAQYAARGVQVFGVDAYLRETPEEVRITAAERGIAYPILMDPQGVLLGILGTKRTTSTYVIDSQGVLRYRGSFDNGRPLDDPERIAYVEKALLAVLEGQEVTTGETEVSGCGIRREE